jgi:hypothetical protein
LFKEDESLQTRLGKDSIRYIEPEEALNDICIVINFIEYVLNCLSEDAREMLKILMKDSRPGCEYTEVIKYINDQNYNKHFEQQIKKNKINDD